MSEARMAYENAAGYTDADQEDGEGIQEEVAVLDDASAEYLLRKIRQAETEYEKMEAWYTHQLALAKERRDSMVSWAERCLRPYFDMVPTKGKKIRSYSLPGGTLKLAKQDPKYEVKDEEMVPWLEKNAPDMVAVKKEAKWGDFKKTLAKDENGDIRMIQDESGALRVMTEDGELVPGVTATLREDKFSVKLK